MKKTLIALAVAASAVVSGSAMAAGWEQNGNGGPVDLGGTLTPADVITPWEVKVGDAVNGLDANIRKGDTTVSIPVENAIPVLGIRTVEATAFQGETGITPQINYNGAIKTSEFNNGYAPLTLDVKSAADDAKIGTLTVQLGASGKLSVNGPGWQQQFHLQALNPGDVFYGGLGAVMPDNDIAMIVFPESGDNFDDQGAGAGVPNNTGISLDAKYSAYYGSGIAQGETIQISLDTPVDGDAQIQWKASLPVTVSYQ
ncbi:hypothetical protein [Escherichia coli]|uniref:F4 family fimbrial subunit n=1 Tax=Escherichia coli TaxID=562 RepID=UPI0010AC9E95|nr:hypothetical protein [Escherichia coli]TJE30753.1 hypothetical protein C9217_26635 [Escherichia coli]